MPEPITPEQIAAWRAAVDANIERGELTVFHSPTMRRILDALEAGERYRAALEWYANYAQYRADLIMGGKSSVLSDAGARARAALDPHAGTPPTTEGERRRSQRQPIRPERGRSVDERQDELDQLSPPPRTTEGQ